MEALKEFFAGVEIGGAAGEIIAYIKGVIEMLKGFFADLAKTTL